MNYWKKQGLIPIGIDYVFGRDWDIISKPINVPVLKKDEKTKKIN